MRADSGQDLQIPNDQMMQPKLLKLDGPNPWTSSTTSKSILSNMQSIIFVFGWTARRSEWNPRRSLDVRHKSSWYVKYWSTWSTCFERSPCPRNPPMQYLELGSSRMSCPSILHRGKTDSPEMGFIFCSFALSFMASCHSLVMVCGGGWADALWGKGRARQHHPELRPIAIRVLGLTEMTRYKEQDTGHRYSSARGKENVQSSPWRVDRCSCAVFTKGDVVRYPGLRSRVGRWEHCQSRTQQIHEHKEGSEDVRMKWPM